jgi:5'-3' exonuclease
MSKSYKSEPRDPKNTLVVDSLNLAYRWKISGKDYELPGEFKDTINSLAKSYDCGKIVVLADGGSSWRKSLHPGYKLSRKLKHENQTELEKKESEDFFRYYQEALDKCGHPVIRLSGVEADDIAAYIVENKYALDINTIWLISSDKDWDLLIEEDVHRFSTVTRKEITFDTWDYPVSIEDYVHFKTLTGDPGDDIPGVEGIGPKRAADLIEQYGSVFDIIASLPLKGTAKYIQNLNTSKEVMLLAYQLIDLRSFHEEAIGDNMPKLKSMLQDIYSCKI